MALPQLHKLNLAKGGGPGKPAGSHHSDIPLQGQGPSLANSPKAGPLLEPSALSPRVHLHSRPTRTLFLWICRSGLARTKTVSVQHVLPLLLSSPPGRVTVGPSLGWVEIQTPVRSLIYFPGKQYCHNFCHSMWKHTHARTHFLLSTGQSPIAAHAVLTVLLPYDVSTTSFAHWVGRSTRPGSYFVNTMEIFGLFHNI